MKQRKLRFVALCTAVSLLCCACAPAESAQSLSSPYIAGSAEPEDAQMLYIGMMLKTLDNPYFTRIKTGAEDAADANNAQIMVVSANDESDTETQTDMLLTMASMALDVLIFSPSGTVDTQAALDRAEQTGKLVMTVDTELSVGTCDCYIGTNHYTAAYREGDYAAKLAGAGAHAVILRGQTGDTAHDTRTVGLRKALTEGGVIIADEIDCGTSEERAAQAVAALLEQPEYPTVICTTSDALAIGAQQAVEESGYTDVYIFSFDAMEEVTQLIADGKITAAIAQDPYRIGQLCVETAVKLSRGESVPHVIYTDAELITADNAADHLKQLEQQSEPNDIYG